jgi:hypothetical protein
MSTYKIVDSTISVLYCAKCANEDLEIVSPGRLVCRDCGMDTTFDTSLIRVGQLKGTKYKMRDKRRYTFREIIDEAREDAFSEVFVPSPEPGRGRVGWRSEEEKEEQEEEVEIKMAGINDDPSKGWRHEPLIDVLIDEANAQEGDNVSENNGRDSADCSL